MYIQITTRCNMKCAHCCYSCTNKGEDMSMEVFRRALKLDDHIELGGGEPTIHPHFWQILGEAIAWGEFVWLSTNGKRTDIAIALAKMARKGVIACQLSLDEFHDAIDDCVIEAFECGLKPTYYEHDNADFRNISRNVHNRVVPIGRANDLDANAVTFIDDCCCPGHIVKPNGNIHQCGCEDSPVIGTVFDYCDIDFDYWEEGECHNDLKSVAV